MKVKKQIKKLKEALAEQDRRIEKIEKELERNSSFTMSKDVLRSITEPKIKIYTNPLTGGPSWLYEEYKKSNQEEKPFVLPENWCIKVTEQNVDFLNTYLENNKDKYPLYVDTWEVEYTPFL